MIDEDRKQFLIIEILNWREGYDGYPSELGEMLGKLNTTDEEIAWLEAENW